MRFTLRSPIMKKTLALFALLLSAQAVKASDVVQPVIVVNCPDGAVTNYSGIAQPVTMSNVCSSASGVASLNASGNAPITGIATLLAGTNITLSQSGSTITITASGSGGGSGVNIYQVRMSTNGTNTSTTSGTFADTGLFGTITLSSNTHHVLILVSGAAYNNDGAGLAYFTLTRNGSNIGPPNGFAETYNASGLDVQNIPILNVDAPASTSLLTYRVQIKTDSSAQWGDGGNLQQTMILIEYGS